MDANRMLVRTPLIGALAAALAAVCTPLHADQPSSSAPPSFNSEGVPSFTAEQILLFPDSEQIIDRSRLNFSDKGMKITRGDGFDRQIFLQNFVSGQTWLIDPRRSVQHEVRYESASPMVSSDSDAPLLIGSGGSSGASQQPLQSGLLSPLPCMDYPRLKQLEITRWRGQAVSTWGCLDETGKLVGTDYFSETWNLVIRSELVNIQIEELWGIKALSFPEGHFRAKADHAPVSLIELIHGVNVAARKYE